MRNVRKTLLVFFVFLITCGCVQSVNCSENVSLDKDFGLKSLAPEPFISFVGDSSVLTPFDASSFQIIPPSDSGACVLLVFIHGTVMPRFSPWSLLSCIKGVLKGGPERERGIGLYQEYMEHVKRNSVHRYQPINRLGLVSIDLQNDLNRHDFGFIGLQTARFYKQIYGKVYPDHKNDFLFYTFAWNGRLCNKSRKDAARELYVALQDELKKVSAQSKKPVELHILAHSHGCNVVLSLDFIEKERQERLRVDRVVFFGCPVQRETEHCIHSDVFKKMYHIYSNGDHMQRLDFVSTCERFSRREFGTSPSSKITLPKKLHQIEVRLADCKPYHYELWLWARNRFPHFFYRRRFPLFPLPLSVFTPVIINLAEQVCEDCDERRLSHLRFDRVSSLFSLRRGDHTYSYTLPMEPYRKEACYVLR